MTQQNNDMSTPFTEVVTNKMKKQDEQIASLQEKTNAIPGITNEISDFKKQLTEVKVAITAIRFPTRQMEELSGKLVTSVTLLKQPVENKVLHHHHFDKIIIITAVLFVILCLTFCGWYNTSQKIDQYRANDYKYRFLKLKSDPAVHRLLLSTDSLHQNNPGFVDELLHGEDSVRKMIQQLVDAKEREVSDLKNKLK
ncbi:hypothetical protein A4H97_33370 [Niastella yeongjuensis]|uniref:Uncharacterized protein n=1 Tax=Niastella yeongjuensis TaxID=354355 RepID=A0A1V9EE95_9BACT|nr:hypothetical protein [Niastella yeongjuensis]OQP44245.1 hypothetical protein A4H97_33370 [Niastella yeongjuensis]SEO40969.1 hypothetical protein SAMN05660816_02847 [Niastella yeongjuensis]